jgi:hypothetical protein
MALDKKGGFGLDLESQFKNAPRVTDVEPVDTHTHTAIEQEGKTKRTYGLVTPTAYKKLTEYAKANKTSYNAIVCDLIDEFIEKKGL